MERRAALTLVKIRFLDSTRSKSYFISVLGRGRVNRTFFIFHRFVFGVVFILFIFFKDP